MEALNKEARIRKERKQEQIEKLKTEQIEFLTKCRNLTQTILPGATETDTDKPLERAYQLFESIVSNLQTQLQTKKDEQVEETFVLLRQKYTKFSEARKVLKEHFEESTTTNEVLRN